MIKKQELLDGMAKENLQDEEVMAIIGKYSEELSDEDVAKLDAELKEFETSNELLSKAYDEMATEFDDQAEAVVDTMDKAVNKVAQTAYDDLSWAADTLKE